MKAILLVNLGTPDEPTPNAVGKYLLEFLMDPRVIDLPYPLRWLLVHRIIVPKRRVDSAKLYQKIWDEKGSPLLYHTRNLTTKVEKLLPQYKVRFAMRYGSPSIASVAESLRNEGVKEVLVFPLYPQYSLAATESVLDVVRSSLKDFGVTVVPPFYSDSAYLDAVADVSRDKLAKFNADLVLFSFHGLPERHVRKTDPSRTHCLKKSDCCNHVRDVNRDCYRAQCYATAHALAKRLEITKEKYIVAFQSRLNQRWIKPFSDDYYRSLPSKGVKRLAVLSPSFVADCLETLEEIGMRGKEEFCRNGGEELILVPSLNSEDIWTKVVAAKCESFYQPNPHRPARSPHEQHQPSHH